MALKPGLSNILDNCFIPEPRPQPQILVHFLVLFLLYSVTYFIQCGVGWDVHHHVCGSQGSGLGVWILSILVFVADSPLA